MDSAWDGTLGHPGGAGDTLVSLLQAKPCVGTSGKAEAGT